MLLRRMLQVLLLGNFVTLVLAASNTKLRSLNALTSKPTTTPNVKLPKYVFLILADDLGWGSASQDDPELMNMVPGVKPNPAYAIQTPNINKLLRKGMRFTNAFASAPLCTPSRAAIISGLPSALSLVRDNSGDAPVYVQFPTIPQFFKSHGYYTKKVGKSALGANGTESAPNDLGFDDFYGYDHDGDSSYPYPRYLWRNTEMKFLPQNKKTSSQKCNQGGCTYAGDLFLEEVRQFMSTLTPRSKPTYFEIALTQPHLGLYVPHSSYASLVPSYGQYAASSMTANRKGYAAMVTDYIDEVVGIVSNAIDAAGIAEQSLIIFTSDNGAQYDPEMLQGKRTQLQPYALQANGGTSMLKYYMYNGGLKVPLAFVYPGVIAENTVSQYPVALYDIFATFKDMFGVATPASRPNANPVSIWPILQGHTKTVSRDYFSTEYCPGNKESTCKYAFFKTTSYATDFMSLVYDIDNYQQPVVNPALNRPANYRHHLYNLTADPQQTVNLYNNPRYQTLIQEMQIQRDRNRIPLPQ